MATAKNAIRMVRQVSSESEEAAPGGIVSEIRSGPTSPSTRRLNVNLPDHVFAELEQLARSSGRSMTEVVRAALGLIAVIIREEKQGHKLVIVGDCGKLLKEIVLPK